MRMADVIAGIVIIISKKSSCAVHVVIPKSDLVQELTEENQTALELHECREYFL